MSPVKWVVAAVLLNQELPAVAKGEQSPTMDVGRLGLMASAVFLFALAMIGALVSYL